MSVKTGEFCDESGVVLAIFMIIGGDDIGGLCVRGVCVCVRGTCVKVYRLGHASVDIVEWPCAKQRMSALPSSFYQAWDWHGQSAESGGVSLTM